MEEYRAYLFPDFASGLADTPFDRASQCAKAASLEPAG